MSGLILPVKSYRGLSTWQAHIERTTPSTEPGTDFYVPIGTPVYAPAAGMIWGYGNSIVPPSGRWVGINFDNGMSFRCMHHSRLVRTSGRVAQGELIAYSGASGYGEEDWSWNPATGGAHTHATLWPDWNHTYGYRYPGMPFTVDLMKHASTPAPVGLGSEPLVIPEREEITDMYSFIRYFDRPGDVHVISHLTGLRAHVQGRDHLGMLQRALTGGPKVDLDDLPTMNAAELAIVRGYLTAINPPAPSIDTDAILQAIADLATAMDETSGASADEIAAAMRGLEFVTTVQDD